MDERGRQLAAAVESKTRFLRNVSHELRSPVSSIIGLSSLLEESGLDADQLQQVRYVRDSADTLLTLVDELLDLARAEAGQQAVEPAPVDLADLVQELRGTIQPLVRPGVDLVVASPGDATLVSDRRLVSRILRNLLTNAVKFTASGSVHLDVGADATGIRLTVRDTGVGIPAESLESVFEEFVQIPNDLQPGVRGTGLGLPYSRRTAEALGGTLTATSTPGEGSAFTLRLPSSPAGPPAGPAAGPAATDTAAPEGTVDAARLGHVLVVDDDHGFAATVAGMLRASAERVSVADRGDHALDLLRDDPADAVVLDVQMPELDGVSVLRTLRAEHPGTAAVLVSAGPAPVQDAVVRPAPFLSKARLDTAMLLAALRQDAAEDRRG
nr:hybrid sensor histidine kinase/response regulator [Isoptericola chiayiensis]